MRRADRLLQIIQILRREGRPIAASRMAEELEVSQRTLYRDMASLESTGVPVRGEAGVGYVLEDGYDMPPLMFTATELEAIMLGARLLDGRVDEEFSRAARDAVAKIATAVPKELRASLVDAPLFAPMYEKRDPVSIDMSALRTALRSERQVWIDYRDLRGNESQRVIWPSLLSFFKNASVVAAWCTVRQDFRTFRLDQIRKLEVLDDRLPRPRKTMFVEWRRNMLETGDMPDVAKNHAGKIYGV